MQRQGDEFQQFNIDTQFCKVLNIQIIQGITITRGKIKDWLFKADPYIRVRVLGTPNVVRQTKHITNSNNPRWNESFQFYIDVERDRFVEFVLFDRNLTVNELIGKEIVCIDHLILPEPGSSPCDRLQAGPDPADRLQSEPGLRSRLEAGVEPRPGSPQSFILTFKNGSKIEIAMSVSDSQCRDMRFKAEVGTDEAHFLQHRDQVVRNALEEIRKSRLFENCEKSKTNRIEKEVSGLDLPLPPLSSPDPSLSNSPTTSHISTLESATQSHLSSPETFKLFPPLVNEQESRLLTNGLVFESRLLPDNLSSESRLLPCESNGLSTLHPSTSSNSKIIQKNAIANCQNQNQTKSSKKSNKVFYDEFSEKVTSKLCDLKPEICDRNVANTIIKCSEIECDEKNKLCDFYLKESTKSEKLDKIPVNTIVNDLLDDNTKANKIINDTLPNGDCNSCSTSYAINNTKVNNDDTATKKKYALTINESNNTQYNINYAENTHTYNDIKTSDFCNDTLVNTNIDFDDTLTTFMDTLNNETGFNVKFNSDNIDIENFKETSTTKVANNATLEDSLPDNLTKPEKFSIQTRKRSQSFLDITNSQSQGPFKTSNSQSQSLLQTSNDQSKLELDNIQTSSTTKTRISQPQNSNYLNNKQDNYEEKVPGLKKLPKLALVTSGGGFRAMIAYSGVYKALHDSGLLDCFHYAGCLSGSCWYLATLYTHPKFPSGEAVNEIIEDLRGCVERYWQVHLSPPWSSRYLRKIVQKYKKGQPVGFTDFFGYLVGEQLLLGRMKSRLSEQRVHLRAGKVPMPLYTCLHVKKNISAKIFQEWYEFNPYELCIPKYGVAMPIEKFGTKFFMGHSVSSHKEVPLHYLYGVWGSAFTILLKRLFLEKEKVESGEMVESGIKNGNDYNLSFQPIQNDASLSPRVMKNSATLPQHINMLFNQENLVQRADDIENLLLLEQDDLISNAGNANINGNVDNSNGNDNIGNANNGLEDTAGLDDNDLVDEYCQQEKPVSKGLLQKCQQQNKTDFQKEFMKTALRKRRFSTPGGKDGTRSLLDMIVSEDSYENEIKLCVLEDFVESLSQKSDSNEDIFNLTSNRSDSSELQLDHNPLDSLLEHTPSGSLLDHTSLSSPVEDITPISSPEFEPRASSRSFRKKFESFTSQIKKQRQSTLRAEELEYENPSLLLSLVEKALPLKSRAGRAGLIHNPLRGLTIAENLEDKTEFQDFTNFPDDLDNRGYDEPSSTDTKSIYLVDSGLSFNIPFPILLRPERDVKFYLVFDFSNRETDNSHPFRELLLSEKWASLHKVPFPKIKSRIAELAKEPVRECYVFKEDDLQCPIIMYFPLINKDFREFSSPGVPRATDDEKEFANFNIFENTNDFASWRFVYPNLSFDRMNKMMEFNVLNNVDLIKKELDEFYTRYS